MNVSLKCDFCGTNFTVNRAVAVVLLNQDSHIICEPCSEERETQEKVIIDRNCVDVEWVIKMSRVRGYMIPQMERELKRELDDMVIGRWLDGYELEKKDPTPYIRGDTELLIKRLTDLVIRSTPRVPATHEYVLIKFWEIWIGEFGELDPILKDKLGKIANEVCYEHELAVLSFDDDARIYDEIKSRLPRESDSP